MNQRKDNPSKEKDDRNQITPEKPKKPKKREPGTEEKPVIKEPIRD